MAIERGKRKLFVGNYGATCMSTIMSILIPWAGWLSLFTSKVKLRVFIQVTNWQTRLPFQTKGFKPLCPMVKPMLFPLHKMLLERQQFGSSILVSYLVTHDCNLCTTQRKPTKVKFLEKRKKNQLPTLIHLTHCRLLPLKVKQPSPRSPAASRLLNSTATLLVASKTWCHWSHTPPWNLVFH